MPIRFRTQDTRASTRRKLNELFELDGEERFFAPTPTLDSWFIKLNGIVRQMLADDYEFDEEPPVFGTSDTRQMTCRKLNRVAAAFEAGPVEPTEEAPANTAAPAITGNATVGEVLTRTMGTWTGTPAPTYATAWKRDGVAIAGATAETYTLVEDDLNAEITVTVTATNSAGNASATSSPVGPVGPGA